ncbi:cytidine and deoxycytidylate deaminase zinc-binding region family protein [Mycobacterium xenopi 4042]|uniref:Cytidine and deoxycytidylate deaminase zinc-binding region family protein n=1 Tax=Mycobacterium xenopi 4042 TaxID=1299334 RepID=X7YR90_MYCXE|nr:cytidine and deoxycytidylate deaminase zinc-binding region family protein [Mycobacterium xenopi 4042]
MPTPSSRPPRPASTASSPDLLSTAPTTRPPPWKRCAARPGHVTASAPMSTPVAISYDAAMRLAVEHAELVKGNTYPNPPVGAVILDREGRVAGAGGTEPAGSAHAEIVALRRAGVWLRAGPRS